MPEWVYPLVIGFQLTRQPAAKKVEDRDLSLGISGSLSGIIFGGEQGQAAEVSTISMNRAVLIQ